MQSKGAGDSSNDKRRIQDVSDVAGSMWLYINVIYISLPTTLLS